MKIAKYLLIGLLVLSLGLVGCSQAESSQDTNTDQITTETSTELSKNRIKLKNSPGANLEIF